MPDVEKTSIFGTAVHAVLRSDATPVETLAARLRARAGEAVTLTVVEPSLEDAYLVLMRKDAPEPAAVAVGA